MKKLFALVLSALVTVCLTVPSLAFASEGGSLQAQSVTIGLPGGGTITVPDGASVDLSGTKASTTKATKAKATTATKKAKKAFKKSGLRAWGAKYGWSLKSKWSTRGAKKAVVTREFAIPAKIQKQGKSLRLRVVQTTWHNAKGWHTVYKVNGKAYRVGNAKYGIKHTLYAYGKR